MKRIIINLEEKTKHFKEIVQEAFNFDFLNFLISKNTYEDLASVERLNLYSKDPELEVNSIIYFNSDKLDQLKNKQHKQHNVGMHFYLKSKDDEKKIIEITKSLGLDFVIVKASDWKIIPFENLISYFQKLNAELIAEVEDFEESELLLKTLEVGVDGILIKPNSVDDIVKLKGLVKVEFRLELKPSRVKEIKNIPESDRVCVDTTSLLQKEEGMLVGSTAMGFALIHAEVFETQFVASRPFRVNAGDVSAYILVPDDDQDKGSIYRTRYLSELKGGDKVLIVNTKGNSRTVTVGRVKIETRPMLRFELEVEHNEKKIPIYCICQNAETVRLINARGKPVSVVDIAIGDEVLVHIGPGATHFGTAIEENIIEK
ncbi:MAG: 3-dehydroquinate synthase II [Promethearchaeota archaeon]|nr:MAG: 3-dehydroquinate synthase II [Candidatus Lokiarchaeota archaeon]